MEVLHNKETYIMCPYNPAHYIRKYKMEGHLVKCRRNYPDSELVRCDFNSSHEMPQAELLYHHKYCADKKFIELAVYEEYGRSSASKGLQRPVNFANFPMEDWDNDSEISYDPESYCTQNEILRKIDVQSAARRRDFRNVERNRFRRFNIPKETKAEKGEPKTRAQIVKEEDEYICKMMEKLNTDPIKAIVPKISKGNTK